jgi:hypothetical protein
MPDDADFGTIKVNPGEALPATPEEANKKKAPPRPAPPKAPVAKSPPAAPSQKADGPAKSSAKPPPAAAPTAAPPAPPPKAAAAPAPPAEPARAKTPTPLEGKAAEVCKLFAPGEEAKKLLAENLTVEAFLQLLMKQQLWEDAANVLAHGVSKREAVWWACQCARSVSGSKPPAKIAEALQVAEKWVKDPSEDNRRPAEAAAKAAEIGTPAGCAALAAFWSGGSLSPPGQPVIPPDETLTAGAAADAVLLAAVATEPEKAEEHYARFLSEGIKIAEGANRWE